jgi:hypothetical protein
MGLECSAHRQEAAFHSCKYRWLHAPATNFSMHDVTRSPTYNAAVRPPGQIPTNAMKKAAAPITIVLVWPCMVRFRQHVRFTAILRDAAVDTFISCTRAMSKRPIQFPSGEK